MLPLLLHLCRELLLLLQLIHWHLRNELLKLLPRSILHKLLLCQRPDWRQIWSCKLRGHLLLLHWHLVHLLYWHLLPVHLLHYLLLRPRLPLVST